VKVGPGKLAAAAALVLAGGAGVFVFRACGPPEAAEPAGLSSAAPALEAAGPAPESAVARTPEVPAMPDRQSFGRPEEARRYFEAKAAGSRRAIEALDQAIARARQDPNATPDHLAALQRARAERAAVLQAAAAGAAEADPGTAAGAGAEERR
jgi:hypothetical protein